MLQNIAILVAEDDPEQLRTVAEAFERLGAVVTRAESGGELVEHVAEKGPFDLIVTDISMSWLTGLQAMQAARNAGIATPTIIMTGLKDATIPAAVQRLGRNVVLLRKPFDVADLEGAAERLLTES